MIARLASALVALILAIGILFAPAGTPAEIVAKLSREVVRVLSLPDIRERMASQGSEAVASTPENFSAFVKAEAAKWQKVIRKAGLEHTQ